MTILRLVQTSGLLGLTHGLEFDLGDLSPDDVAVLRNLVNRLTVRDETAEEESSAALSYPVSQSGRMIHDGEHYELECDDAGDFYGYWEFSRHELTPDAQALVQHLMAQAEAMPITQEIPPRVKLRSVGFKPGF